MIALRWNIAQAFERLWWRNYLNGKDKSLYLNWKKSYWDRILQQVFNMIGPESAGFNDRSLCILDAGCGPAGIFLNLRNHYVDALDPLMNQYLLEHQLINKADYPNVNFMKGKLETFFAPETYDYVFCMNCINHVNDIGLCFNNIVKGMKKGAFLVLTVDAHKYTVVKRFLKVIPADILHPYQLSLDDYTSFLEKKFKAAVTANRLIKRGILFDHSLVVVQKKALA